MAISPEQKENSKADQKPAEKQIYKLPPFDRVLLYLGQRDHSESELRTKMRRKYEPGEITAAIEKAKSGGYLPDTEEQLQKLSEKVAASLHRKKKGIQFINGYLRQKGLPPVAVNSEVELEKATEILKSLIRKNSAGQDFKKKQQQIRSRLVSRGFHSTTISQVLNQFLKMRSDS